MIRIFTTLILLSTISLLNAQSTKRVFYLGHSLINFEIPNIVQKLSEASNTKLHSQRNIGNGANLSWHWTQRHTGQGDRWDTTLANQEFDQFILTEAIALKAHLKWSNTYGYLDSLYNYAAKKSPNIKLFVYETWHCINSGTSTKCMYDDDSHIPWVERLTLDLPLWEGIAEHLNKRKPNTAFLVPGGQGILRLHNAIQEGRLPGFTSSRQLFSDDIHLTNIGNYFIACIMYSVIHKKSPEGLPNRLATQWGVPYEVFPTPAQALELQKIAWETICNYKNDDVECATKTKNVEDQTNYRIIQNADYIQIMLLKNESSNIQLLDLQGKIIWASKVYQQDVIFTHNLNSGIYLLTTSDGEVVKIFIE